LDWIKRLSWRKKYRPHLCLLYSYFKFWKIIINKKCFGWFGMGTNGIYLIAKWMQLVSKRELNWIVLGYRITISTTKVCKGKCNMFLHRDTILHMCVLFLKWRSYNINQKIENVIPQSYACLEHFLRVVPKQMVLHVSTQFLMLQTDWFLGLGTNLFNAMSSTAPNMKWWYERATCCMTIVKINTTSTLCFWESIFNETRWLSSWREKGSTMSEEEIYIPTQWS
jgi:hypothetical protein